MEEPEPRRRDLADNRSIVWGLQLAAHRIPQGVGQQEREDRLTEFQLLSKRAADPEVPVDLRNAYGIRADAVLTAPPRDQVAREHAAIIAKSRIMGGPEADRLQEQARQLIEEKSPPAPYHGAAVAKARVRKAKAKLADDDLMPVFDAAGQLVGIAHQGDVTPVAGQRKPPAEHQVAVDGNVAPVPGPDDAEVAKSGLVHVWDQYGQRYRVRPQRIMRSNPGRRVAKGAPKVAIYDQQGRHLGMVDPDSIDPGEQARNAGPVRAGGTTGMGQPRQGGGDQRVLPGDVADRAVIKAAIKALGPNYRCVYDYAGSLVGAVRQRDITRALPAGTVAKSAQDQSHASVYNSRRQKVGVARLADIIPLATLRRR
jgi:hypothetical protein